MNIFKNHKYKLRKKLNHKIKIQNLIIKNFNYNKNKNEIRLKLCLKTKFKVQKIKLNNQRFKQMIMIK